MSELSAAHYAQILLPLPVEQPFDYRIPEGVALQQGDFVRVPFGHQTRLGVVWAITDHSKNAEKCKPVQEVIQLPSMQPKLQQFIDWVASYTLAPKGQVLHMAMSAKEAFKKAKPILKYTIATNSPNQRMTAKRKVVLEYLADGIYRTKEEILQHCDITAATLQTMVKQQILQVHQSFELPSLLKAEAHYKAPTLSAYQEEAATLLCQKVEEGNFATTLLDGVTGSGKTEVYFAAIEKVLAQEEGQILVLLPEIVLTTQFMERFNKRFGFMPIQWHSSLSAGQRGKAWKQVQDGTGRLVVGARSALFLPFKELRLIIVDEEHEGAFKQEDRVIYHGRDMAVTRAYIENIPIILASATPSLESWINVETNKYSRVHLPERHAKASLPDIEIVDMRKHRSREQKYLSSPLIKALSDTLKQRQQAMLYLNRRGYAPLTLCGECGTQFKCPHCTAWLVNHHGKTLDCHHCGFSMKMPKSCPECHHEGDFVACGPGVERISESVTSLFPEARIVVMTSDTVHSKKDSDRIIESILKHEVDIIIGTQMIAKGHHFPQLTLVGVVDADLGLSGGDLRASERTYQLLHQVAGRAGREAEKGRVILQTYMPDNQMLHALVTHNRDDFYRYEMENRKMFSMPPFAKMASLIISGKREQEVVQVARQLVKTAPVQEGVIILGPTPAPLHLLRGRFRYRILVRTDRDIHLQEYLRFWLTHNEVPRAVQIKVDVDPYSFL